MAVSVALLAAATALADHPSMAQDQDCTCIGLGPITLPDAGAGPGSEESPLSYKVPAAPGLAAIDARIRLSCTSGGDGAATCKADVQAAITMDGDTRLSEASARSSASAPACLILGQALEKAWKDAVGPDRPDRAPAPCS